MNLSEEELLTGTLAGELKSKNIEKLIDDFNQSQNRKSLNKGKLKFLPFNLLHSLSVFALTYFIMVILLSIPTWSAFIIALYVYFLNVIDSSNSDYLEARIKKLEDKLK